MKLTEPRIRDEFGVADTHEGGFGVDPSAEYGVQEGQAAGRQNPQDVIGPTNWPFRETRVPFHERKAKIKWPNDAKLAVRVYLTLEWSSGPQNPPGSYYMPDLNTISLDSQYTFNVGCHRAINVLEKHGIKGSIFPNGGVVAAYPDLHKQLHAAGHEITARSWDQGAAPYRIRPEALGNEVKRTTDAITQITGKRPVGWISPGAKCTPLSVKTLADMGYLWFGDLNGDDLPYGVSIDNRSIVCIPHRAVSTNDFTIFNRDGGRTFRDIHSAFDFFRNTFDAYYETASNEAPNTMMYGIHPYWSCWPDRIKFHDKALAYMTSFKDVWFATHAEIAQWAKDNYLKA